MILDKQSGGKSCGDGQMTPRAATKEGEIKNNQHSAAEVTKLKEMLTQRDNEISIL